MEDQDLTSLIDRSPLHLELGAGQSKRMAAAVAIDLLPLPGVDIVADAFDVLKRLPAGSVDSIHSEHFLEHIEDFSGLIELAAKVLKPGGRFTAITPHFSNPYFYSDPTHHTFFGLYTFAYLVAGSPLTRRVPTYIEPLPFDQSRPKHVFKSPRPFYFRYALKRLVGWVVNLNGWTQEFYEENLCWILPCYEIEYELVRR